MDSSISTIQRVVKPLHLLLRRYLSELIDRSLGVLTADEAVASELGVDIEVFRRTQRSLGWSGVWRTLRHVHLTSSDVLLDIGCGAGRAICGAARTPVATVVGIDIDPRMVELARANAGPLRGRRCEEVVEHAEGDSGNEAIRRSFPDKPWLAARTGLDAISARSCLLNLSDLESLLRRAAGYTSSVTRVLRPMQSVTPPTNAVGDSPRTPLALAAGKLSSHRPESRPSLPVGRGWVCRPKECRGVVNRSPRRSSSTS